MIQFISSFPINVELPLGFIVIPETNGLQLKENDIWLNDRPWEEAYSMGHLNSLHHPWNRRIWVQNKPPKPMPGTPANDMVHPTLRRAEGDGLTVVQTREEAIQKAILIARGMNAFCPSHVRIISLAKRQDRRREMRANWESHGQSLENAIWQDAVVASKPKLGAMACRKSHVIALETAFKENPDGWTLILEDDAHWIPEQGGEWPSRSPDDDTAIAYLGAAVHQWKESNQNGWQQKRNWEQVQAWYAHAYAVNGKMIPQILNLIRASPETETIDTIYCMIVARKMKCQAWIPSLFTQAPGPSDIEQVVLDRREKVLALDLLIREHRTINPNIPAFVCLNLKTREDKLVWMRGEMERIGMEPIWWRVDKDETNPVRGCFHSHIQIWREALRQKVPWVFVIEDDIEFTSKTMNWERIPADWEMLYFGGNTANVHQEWGNDEWKPVQSWSTYAYAIRTSLIGDWERQGLLDKPEGAVDQWLLERVHPNARVYRQVSPWVIPRSGEEISDCSGKTMNYDFLRKEGKLEVSPTVKAMEVEETKTFPKVSLLTPTLKGRVWFWNALHCFLKQDYPRELMEWVILDEGESNLQSFLPDDSRIKYFHVSDIDRKEVYRELVSKLRREEPQRLINTVELPDGRQVVSTKGLPFRKKQRGKTKIKRDGAPNGLLDIHRSTPWKEDGDFWRNRLPMGMKRNWLVSQATGEVMIHWDDDDWYPATSVSKRVQTLIQSGKSIVGCTTIPCFDTTVCMSWMNVPPQTDQLKDRLSEATMAYWKSVWEKQRFDSQIIGGEGSSFIEGRENDFKEMSYDGVIISLVHRGNLSSRKRPSGHEPNGWHFGEIPESEFTLITQVDNQEFPHQDWLRAFVLKPYLS